MIARKNGRKKTLDPVSAVRRHIYTVQFGWRVSVNNSIQKLYLRQIITVCFRGFLLRWPWIWLHSSRINSEQHCCPWWGEAWPHHDAATTCSCWGRSVCPILLNLEVLVSSVQPNIFHVCCPNPKHGLQQCPSSHYSSRKARFVESPSWAVNCCSSSRVSWASWLLLSLTFFSPFSPSAPFSTSSNNGKTVVQLQIHLNCRVEPHVQSLRKKYCALKLLHNVIPDLSWCRLFTNVIQINQNFTEKLY